jgi:hypothetical protein
MLDQFSFPLEMNVFTRHFLTNRTRNIAKQYLIWRYATSVDGILTDPPLWLKYTAVLKCLGINNYDVRFYFREYTSLIKIK